MTCSMTCVVMIPGSAIWSARTTLKPHAPTALAITCFSSLLERFLVSDSGSPIGPMTKHVLFSSPFPIDHLALEARGDASKMRSVQFAQEARNELAGDLGHRLAAEIGEAGVLTL